MKEGRKDLRKKWLHNVESDLRYAGVKRWTLIGPKLRAGGRGGGGSNWQRFSERLRHCTDYNASECEGEWHTKP